MVEVRYGRKPHLGVVIFNGIYPPGVFSIARPKNFRPLTLREKIFRPLIFSDKNFRPLIFRPLHFCVQIQMSLHFLTHMRYPRYPAVSLSPFTVIIIHSYLDN